MAGKLTIVPTPIGNLGDMTQRSIEALSAADTVCAEDTRVTGKLLSVLGIVGKHVERLDENLIEKRAAAIVTRMQGGERIAYCSDAGMPGVSDPGLRLVRAARQANIDVEVLPGPTAVSTAYVASGTTSTAFYFGGFFPRKDKARRDLLEGLRMLDAALIFYESPNRITQTLAVIADMFPQREVAVCRELTKLHEEVVRGMSTHVATDFAARETVKGEVVVVIDPPASDESAADESTIRAYAAERVAAGERHKSITRALVSEFGVSRNDAYDLVLEIAKERGEAEG